MSAPCKHLGSGIGSSNSVALGGPETCLSYKLMSNGHASGPGHTGCPLRVESQFCRQPVSYSDGPSPVCLCPEGGLNNHQHENVGSHQKKIPHIQGQRRDPSKMVRWAKSHLESDLIPTRDAWRAQRRLSQTCF